MLKRSISPFSLLLTSISAILGSGWLFSAYYTSKLAGPSAILAWVIGGAATIIISFIFAELCVMLPITGSSARIPYYTHGTLVSFLFAWIIWLTYASFASTEVQAVLQYFSYFFPSLAKNNGGLTSYGYLFATVLMLAISALNIFSLQWLLRCNNVLTLLKIAIPVFVAVVILAFYFYPHQRIYTTPSTFLPYGMHGVFSAVTSGGIVFAFNGFKQACEMAGEAKNPTRALPFAVIGSVIICLIIYLLLQFAFLTSIIPVNLIYGWSHLMLLGNTTSPLTAIVHQKHLDMLLPILYTGAIIGPIAAALMYTSGAARSLYGMSKNHHISSVFQKLLHGNPVVAIVTNFLLGMSLFIPLPGWNSMITFLTSLIALTYSIGPICLLTLRKQLPDYYRPFKLPFVTVWANFSFYLCTLLTYWSGWTVISKLEIALLIGVLVLFIQRAFIMPDERASLNGKAALWIWPYLIGITLISYLGDYGGKGIIPSGWDFFVIGLFCMFIMWLAVKFRLPTILTQHYMKDRRNSTINHQKN